MERSRISKRVLDALALIGQYNKVDVDFTCEEQGGLHVKNYALF